MAQIPGYDDGFNAEEVAPSGAFEPLPRGKYVAIITRSEVKNTKKNDGQYLSLMFKIVEGDYEGRTIFANLNMVNKSADAQRIARQQFSAICHAVDVLNPQDTSELHGIPLMISVKIRPETDTYAASNDIVGYGPVEEDDEDDEDGAPW